MSTQHNTMIQARRANYVRRARRIKKRRGITLNARQFSVFIDRVMDNPRNGGFNDLELLMLISAYSKECVRFDL